MYYRIADDIALRGWRFIKAAYYRRGEVYAEGLSSEELELLLCCDSEHDLPDGELLSELLEKGLIEPCIKGERPSEWSVYRKYEHRYFPKMNLMITGRCNYNCLHCFHAADGGMQKESFTWDEAVSFLNDTKECGVSAIRLTGGEPMMYPHFRQLLKKMHDIGMPLKTLITNGALFDEDTAAYIKELHPDAQIMFSFDGIGTHDWLRQHKGSEEEVRKAIRAAVSFGFDVRINTNVNRRNRDVICDSVKMLSDIGVDFIRIIKTTEAPRWQLNAADDSMTIEEYYGFSTDFAKWYIDSGLTLPVTIWQSLYIRGRDKTFHILPVKSSRCTYRDDAKICGAMLRKLSVQANGDIIPCAPLGGLFTLNDIHMGNVKTDGLKKLLSEGALYDCVTHTAGDKKNANPKCRNCRHFINCQGGCPALSFLFGGSDLSTDEYKCTFFDNGWYKKYAEVFAGWNNMVPLTEEETT